MNHLAKNQVALLEKLATTEKIEISSLSPPELEICKYLENQGYANIKRYSAGVNYVGHPCPVELISVSISEHGKAYLYERNVLNRRWRITTSIALFALIAAIAAIVLSPLFTVFFSKLYGL